MIPQWKRAAADGIEVGVDDPEVGTSVVDGSHIVCSCADVNCSLATGTTQLVCFNTALKRITLPTEWRPYVLQMPTGERCAPIVSSLDMICCKNLIIAALQSVHIRQLVNLRISDGAFPSQQSEYDPHSHIFTCTSGKMPPLNRNSTPIRASLGFSMITD